MALLPKINYTNKKVKYRNCVMYKLYKINRKKQTTKLRP